MLSKTSISAIRTLLLLGQQEKGACWSPRRVAEALEQYEALAGYYPGEEARCRFALLLEGQPLRVILLGLLLPHRPGVGLPELHVRHRADIGNERWRCALGNNWGLATGEGVGNHRRSGGGFWRIDHGSAGRDFVVK